MTNTTLQLLADGAITEEQYQAAQRVAMLAHATGSTGGLYSTCRNQQARDAYRMALAIMGRNSSVVVRVTVNRTPPRNPRELMILRRGLDQLVSFWRST